MYAVQESSIGVVCEILRRRNRVEERFFVNWVMETPRFQVNLLSRITTKKLNDLPSSFFFQREYGSFCFFEVEA